MKQLLALMAVILLCSAGDKPVLTVELQPYTGISQEYVNTVRDNLLKIYPKVIVNPFITLPKRACVGGRYRSDTLLKDLSASAKKNTVVIGLTDKDITCQSNGVKDWGIFGYGQMPGNACVASSYRLNKANKAIQLYKTVIHELGHTQGLSHCPTEGCIMSDAKGKNTMDKENQFCTKCKDFLVKKHWKL